MWCQARPPTWTLRMRNSCTDAVSRCWQCVSAPVTGWAIIRVMPSNLVTDVLHACAEYRIDDRDAVLGMNPSPDALISIFRFGLSVQQSFPFCAGLSLSQGCPFSSGLSLSKGCPLSQGCLPTEPFGVFPVISTPCRTTTGPVPLQDSEGQAGTFPATVQT